MRARLTTLSAAPIVLAWSCLSELQIGLSQKVPWHDHTNIHDTL
jgi:hypothetical protein